MPQLRELLDVLDTESSTEEQYQRARAAYQAPRAFRHTMLELSSFVAVVFGCLVTVGAFVDNRLARDIALGLASFGVAAYALWFLARLNWLERRSDTAWYHVYLLRPAQGLRAAAEAKAILAAGTPLVRAWHTLATAEGRKLRRVDVAIMQALYNATGHELPVPTCFDLLARKQVPYARVPPARAAA